MKVYVKVELTKNQNLKYAAESGMQNDNSMEKLISIKSRTGYNLFCFYSKNFPGILIRKSVIKAIIRNSDIEHG